MDWDADMKGNVCATRGLATTQPSDAVSVNTTPLHKI